MSSIQNEITRNPPVDANVGAILYQEILHILHHTIYYIFLGPAHS